MVPPRMWFAGLLDVVFDFAKDRLGSISLQVKRLRVKELVGDKAPYYFGMERLCAMSTNNVEELLALAAGLYDGMRAKQALRRQTVPQLLPREQERPLKDVASKEWNSFLEAILKGYWLIAC